MGIFKKLAPKILPKPTGKTLYFPGCLAQAKLPRVVEAQRAVLHDMGVEHITLNIECCGYLAWYAGYEEEFALIAARNNRAIKENNITKIITGCPHCALTFKERYGIETRHLLEVYAENMEKIKHHRGHAASYHHPCFLDKLGVDAKVATRVLRRTGVHVAPENKANGCCGSVGDDFARNNPDEARLIAQRRAGELTTPIVTSCPYCIMMFRQQRKDVKDVAELLNE